MPSANSILPRNPYRLFHLSARLRLRSPSTPPPSPQATNDDYYSLLLSTPPSTPAKKTTNPLGTPEASQPSSSPSVPPPSSAAIETSSKGPENTVLFSAPLEGPSARMRGLARAEKGLDRPKEPDNCCMSGCVNCVWDAYREEVEGWAAERRRRERRMHARSGSIEVDDEGGVGELDEPGGRGFEGMDGEEEGMFEGVPVGIREFMNTEKRLRERRRGEQERGRETERVVA